ncbi:MAG: hypothetical protein KDD62_07015 [Bdellovibrionales bacterium]|nr:hypothetical protein [Bdellovibrionales bacterium]
MSDKHESSVLTYSPSGAIEARKEIFDIFKHYPATEEETERSLGLFLRGSLMARIFAIREVYELIVDVPGSIVDLGTWRGQTAVICENLRAIFEPLHFNRRIICLDTFEGYQGFSEQDKATELHKDGTYSTGADYVGLLERLLKLHETSNAMGHINGKHKVIKGDCTKTLPNFFEENPHEFVSLAFFDLNAFNPTLEAFKLIYSKLVPNGVVAFWQLTRPSVPAEGKVYTSSILEELPHTILRSKFYPGLCYLVKQ